MFSTWNSVAHVIALQVAIAFYYLVWPWLKKGLSWRALWRTKQASDSDDSAGARHQKSAYRGKWRDAQYQDASQSRAESDTQARQSPPRHPSVVDPVKSKHHSSLGLNEPVHLIDIKSAYRQLAKRYHPDRFATEAHSEADRAAAARRMREINGAYDWLRVNA